MSEFHVDQSLPICIALASLGGTLEVAATAITALPSVREQQGYLVSPAMRWTAVIANVLLQMMGGLFSALLATWFGPVSIVVPFYYCATLLTNMIVFGVLLGVETFQKPMLVGTHVIVLAVILLPVVGPTVSPDQTFDSLIEHWYSIVWFLFLFVTTLVTGGILILHASPTNTDAETNRFLKQYSPTQRTIVLLLCRAATMSLDLTVSRCLVLSPPAKWVIWALIGTKLWSGNLCTYAIVVQSYSVEQARYVPLNATMVILVNALTGLLVWEDEPQSWYGYFCVFWLLGIGCDLLLSVPSLLTPENVEFGTNMSASLILTEGVRKLTGESEEHKRLLTNYHPESLMHDSKNDDDAPTPKRKGYQSIHHVPPLPTSDSNEGSLFVTPQKEQEQQQHLVEDDRLTFIPRHLQYSTNDQTDGLAVVETNPKTSPLTPTTPAAASWSDGFLLWNTSSTPSLEEGSHASGMSSREAWSEVLHISSQNRRLRTKWDPLDDQYYMDTQRIPSPIPSSNHHHGTNHHPHLMIPSIPTIPSDSQLVLENNPSSSSLTSNEQGSRSCDKKGNLKESGPNGNQDTTDERGGTEGEIASC